MPDIGGTLKEFKRGVYWGPKKKNPCKSGHSCYSCFFIIFSMSFLRTSLSLQIVKLLVKSQVNKQTNYTGQSRAGSVREKGSAGAGSAPGQQIREHGR